jgi:hypothetical protein
LGESLKGLRTVQRHGGHRKVVIVAVGDLDVY